MDWFLYDNGPRHERVKTTLHMVIGDKIPVIFFKLQALLPNSYQFN